MNSTGYYGVMMNQNEDNAAENEGASSGIGFLKTFIIAKLIVIAIVVIVVIWLLSK